MSAVLTPSAIGELMQSTYPPPRGFGVRGAADAAVDKSKPISFMHLNENGQKVRNELPKKVVYSYTV